jgi:hypothetical protein
VSVSKTQLIIPFNDHVALAVWSAAVLTSIGMLMDFCLPVPLDMRHKKGDQQIYIQKIIRGAIGLLIMALEVYEVFYLRRLHRSSTRFWQRFSVQHLVFTHRVLSAIHNPKPACRDIVWAKTPLAELLNAFSAGFFIYEMIGLVSVCVPPPPPPPPPPPSLSLPLSLPPPVAAAAAAAVNSATAADI